MDADESHLEEIYSVCLTDIVKVQAVIRGWLVRKCLLEIHQLYENIVADIDGGDMAVTWPDDRLAYPIMQKSNSKKISNSIASRYKGVKNNHETNIVNFKECETSNSNRNHNCGKKEVSSSQLRSSPTSNGGTLNSNFEYLNLNAEDTHVKNNLQASDVSIQTHSSNLHQDPHNKKYEEEEHSSGIVNIQSEKTSKGICVAIQTKSDANVQTDCDHTTDNSHKYKSQELSTKESHITSVDLQVHQSSPHSLNYVSHRKSNVDSPFEDENEDKGISESYSKDNHLKSDQQKPHKIDASIQFEEEDSETGTEKYKDSEKGKALTKLPDDSSELTRLQKTTAMELLWVQQAIISRKNYLRIKQQLQ